MSRRKCLPLSLPRLPHCLCQFCTSRGCLSARATAASPPFLHNGSKPAGPARPCTARASSRPASPASFLRVPSAPSCPASLRSASFPRSLDSLRSSASASVPPIGKGTRKDPRYPAGRQPALGTWHLALGRGAYLTWLGPLPGPAIIVAEAVK